MNTSFPVLRRTLQRGILLSLVIVAIALSGCASRGGQTYNDGDLRRAQSVDFGTVVDVNEVQVEDDPSLLGPAIGGVAGGVIGSLVGSGAGGVLMTVGGALGGALIGGAAEAYATTYSATQLTIELESGENILVVQGNDEFFVRGDQVRVIAMGNGKVRIQHR